ncbi:protein kinase domain-containing protein [Luteimonas aquatica]|uniref:serine/threonine-protein kinase n=1 Tax=Luteimonas aquatica TaxID=450364 RepID=UPI001F568DF1|nr:serine/threonine-protein kinase [Luteimonas aquatica]
MTTPSVAARALAAFDAYAELDEPGRTQALDLLQVSDPELHAELRLLLHADAHPGLLQTSPVDILAHCQSPATAAGEAASDARMGTLLGPWRIDAILGSGGMGTVYRAHRDDGQYLQTVALKCVRTEIPSPVLADAIRNERHALARLSHPNIASLLDGGIDPQGHPWFAMQLVQGEPIDRWCDARTLGLRERVALFVQACEGVAYAHGKATLHSDIKPSNVLVDDDGRPMLLDFGLSSLTAPDWTQAQPRVAMTLGYTAPEALHGAGNSVAADVYALGAVLYRLLCDQWPADVMPLRAGLPPPLEDPRWRPRPPSKLVANMPAKAVELRRATSAAALRRQLAGDLDSIAMKCVAPDPAYRYRSVAQLQDELRRWLSLRPLQAREGDAGYRLRLFVRRNRLAVALGVGVVASLALGAGIAYRHSYLAEREAESARDINRLFEDTIGAMTLTGLSQAPLASAEMLRVAERRLRERGASAPPPIRALGLMALARNYATLGDYRHAMSMVEEVQGMHLTQADEQAGLHATLARLLNIQSRYPEAARAANTGLEAARELDGLDGDMARLSLTTELARAQWGMARLDDANATLNQALASAEAMASRDPVPLAELLTQRGAWRAQLLHYQDAERDLARAIRLTEKRDPVAADNVRAELAHTLYLIGKGEGAMAVAQTLLANRRRMLGENHPETGKAWVRLAESQYTNSQLSAAMDSAKKGEAILRTVLGPEHPEVGQALQVLSSVHLFLGEHAASLDEARRAFDIAMRAHGPSHQETIMAMRGLAATLASKASQNPGNPKPWPEIIDLFTRVVGESERQGLPAWGARLMLIRARLRYGQDQGADAELERIATALTKLLGPGNDRALHARYIQVELYQKQNRPQDAERAARILLRNAEQALPSLAGSSMVFNSHDILGDIALARGDSAAARAHWQKASEVGQQLGATRQTAVVGVQKKLAMLEQTSAATAMKPRGP